MSTCTHAHAHVKALALMHTCTWPCKHVCKHTHTHTHTLTHAHTHKHTQTHTNTFVHWLQLLRPPRHVERGINESHFVQVVLLLILKCAYKQHRVIKKGLETCFVLRHIKHRHILMGPFFALQLFSVSLYLTAVYFLVYDCRNSLSLCVFSKGKACLTALCVA